jgi:VWFA-related protein
MARNIRHLLFLAALLLAPAVSAQQSAAPTEPRNGRIYLDVVVTQKSGLPVSGLQQNDFTLLDNKVPQTITSFQAVDGRHDPIEVILVVDAVNIGYEVVAYERDQIDKFLRADGGHLAHPAAVAVLTDTGTQIQRGFSIDGNTLSASLDQYTVSLRFLRRSARFWGAVERFQYSLEALQELAGREASVPGRKIILWISPGWPVLSGPEVFLGEKEQQQLFADIVGLSTRLLQGRITLYSIDPLGNAEAASIHVSYWENFLKGVRKPSQVQLGNLALEVLATQSGGVALNSSNDITALLRECLADTRAYYEISFDPPRGDQSHEYHQLEIHVTKPGLTARTRQGYYSLP